MPVLAPRPIAVLRLASQLTIILGLLAVAAVRPGRADWRETFETPQPSWQLKHRDSHSMRVKQHERTFQQAHSGQGSEYLRLQAEFGTFIHYGHDIPPGRVIDELAISVWVKSNRAGIQLLASIVLPRTLNPRDGTPLRTALYGTSYDDVNKWQQLVIQSPLRLLKQQEASLRFQYGPELDIREAYVDLVVVNAYGGRGETQLWLDDLELTGHVATPLAGAASHGTSAPRVGLPPDGTLPAHVRTAPPVSIQEAQLLEGDRPFFLRLVEHQGESFAWLRSLGFNAVRLQTTPTEDHIAQAREQQLWLVAPPPPTDQAAAPPVFDRLLAWDLGDRLGAGDVERIRTQAGRWRTSSPAPAPLLTGSAELRYADYRRICDFLVVAPPPPGSSFELAHWTRWLLARQREGDALHPLVASVPTDPPIELQLQWQALNPGPPLAVNLEPEQLRLMVYHAVAAGVRGIYFRSTGRLDADDESTRLRARTLELLNAELRIIEPWLAGGRAVGLLDTKLPRLDVYGIETARAQLMLYCRTAEEQQFVVPHYAEQQFSLTTPVTSSSASLYQLLNAGLVRIPTDRVAGGRRAELTGLGLAGAFVLTQENLVLDHVGQLSAEGRPRRAQLQLEIQQIALTQAQRLRALRSDLQDPLADRCLQLSGQQLEHARKLTSSSDFRAAEAALLEAANQLARARRIWWEKAARTFVSSASSPFCINCGTLPLHWTITQQARLGTWSGNAMPAGGMEDLRHLLESGWQRETVHSAAALQQVELSYQSPHSGRMCLELINRATGSDELPPTTVRSAPVPVRAGQLVQIHGWLHIAEPLGPRTDGFRITDSLAGPALAQRHYRTTGWQEFCIYRAVSVNHALQIEFQLTAPGQVWIDDVSVRTLDFPVGTP